MTTNDYKIGNVYLDSNDELWFVKSDFLYDILESFYHHEVKQIDEIKDLTFVGNAFDFIKMNKDIDLYEVNPPIKTELPDEIHSFKQFVVPDTVDEMMEIFNKDKKNNHTLYSEDVSALLPHFLKENQRIGDIYWNPANQTGWMIRKSYSLNSEYYLLTSLLDISAQLLNYVDECIYIGNIVDEISKKYPSLKYQCVTDSDLEEYRFKLYQDMKESIVRLEASVDECEDEIRDLEASIESTIYEYYDCPEKYSKKQLMDYYGETIHELQMIQNTYVMKLDKIQDTKQEIKKFEQHQIANVN